VGYINSVVNLGTNGVVVGKQLAAGSYPYSSDTTYDISLTFTSGTAKLGVTFSQGSASPLTESFSTGQLTLNAVGYALGNGNGNDRRLHPRGQLTPTEPAGGQGMTRDTSTPGGGRSIPHVAVGRANAPSMPRSAHPKRPLRGSQALLAVICYLPRCGVG
jgi:hypothetical protein